MWECEKKQERREGARMSVNEVRGGKRRESKPF